MVTDNGADPKSGQLTVEVQVVEVNNPPVFQPVGLQTAQEGTPFTLTLVAVDPDSPPKSIRYRLETAPSRATLDPVTGVFAWQPLEEDGPGSYQVVAHADEEGGAPSTMLTFSIVVSEKNEPPTIQAIPNFDVSEGDAVAFKVVASGRRLSGPEAHLFAGERCSCRSDHRSQHRGVFLAHRSRPGRRHQCHHGPSGR